MSDWIDRIICGDARDLSMIPDESIDLVVTSPPYNAGIAYNVWDDHLDWTDYFDFIDALFCSYMRKLKHGGRLCVNVANTGRKPYAPLEAYFTKNLEDIGFKNRGQIIWNKAASVGSSTAWGSWCNASNPTLRDVHEYILVFSKGDWAKGYRGDSDTTAEEFMEWTKSIWTFPTASAKKVGHPAPFPPELPKRLIKLYSYKDDVIADFNCGAGTTLVEAKRLGRHFVGVDIDPAYVELSRKNIEGVATT